MIEGVFIFGDDITVVDLPRYKTLDDAIFEIHALMNQGDALRVDIGSAVKLINLRAIEEVTLRERVERHD